MTIFKNVTPCMLSDMFQLFGGIGCHLPCGRRQQVFPNCWTFNCHTKQTYIQENNCLDFVHRCTTLSVSRITRVDDSVFNSLSTWTAGSNPTRDVDVCTCFFCVCVILCRYRPCGMSLFCPSNGTKWLRIHNF